MRLAAVAVVGALLILGLARAEGLTKRGMSEDDYKDWIEDLGKKNNRPVRVSAHSVNGKPRFTGVGAPNPARRGWVARHGLSVSEFQGVFDGNKDRGHRLVTACAYLEGGQVKYLGVWVKEDQPISWSLQLDLPARSVEGAIAEARKQGLRPEAISAVRTAKGARYQLQFIGDDGAAWVARFGLGRAEYQRVMADHAAKGHRPVWASAFADGKMTRYNLVLIQDASRRSEAQHDLTEEGLEKALVAMGRRGMRLTSLAEYAGGPGRRYVGVWEGELELPASGAAVPELAGLDEAMRRYMREHDVRCGALAVMKGGKLVLSRGYGYARRDGSRKVGPDDPFRLGSISKPITAAAVRALVKSGKLSLDTRAFVFLGTRAPNGERMDDRLKSVTVGHLLDHKGGWDSAAGPLNDVMFQPQRVARGLKRPLPLGAGDFVHFMAGQPLQFAPGSKAAYSNFGYCVLGRVIEKASGMSYEQYVRKTIAAPLGIKTLRVGRSLPGERPANEPYYRDLASGPNLQTGKGQVPFPDGAFLIEAMDSHGGLIASAPDVARFLDGYLLDGRPREGGVAVGTFFGSLPGAFAVARQRFDGVNFVALFNQRVNPDGRKPERIEDLLDGAIKAVKKWP